MERQRFGEPQCGSHGSLNAPCWLAGLPDVTWVPARGLVVSPASRPPGWRGPEKEGMLYTAPAWYSVSQIRVAKAWRAWFRRIRSTPEWEYLQGHILQSGRCTACVCCQGLISWHAPVQEPGQHRGTFWLLCCCTGRIHKVGTLCFQLIKMMHPKLSSLVESCQCTGHSFV